MEVNLPYSYDYLFSNIIWQPTKEGKQRQRNTLPAASMTWASQRKSTDIADSGFPWLLASAYIYKGFDS